MRSSSCGRHDADSRSQSARVGVRLSGSEASAVRISSRLSPTCWAMRMNDTRRSVSRCVAALAAARARGVDQALGLVEPQRRRRRRRCGR